MESQFFLSIDGQEIQQSDVNLISTDAALADDRVFAEFIRLPPFDSFGNIAKGIWPSGYGSQYLTSYVGPIVTPHATGLGSVDVHPFRAFVGVRSTTTGAAKLNLRDIRSQLFAAASTDDGIATVALSPNSSGHPRWDLIYAQVSVDANNPAVLRYVKDPITGIAAPTSTAITKSTSVAILVQQGTPSSTPSFMAPPADSSGVYNIRLAFVRVPDGFISSSFILHTDICDQAPIACLHGSNGSVIQMPAAAQNLMTVTTESSWGNSSFRPTTYMPPSMTGAITVVAAIDMNDPNPSNWSHLNGTTIDGSYDFRNRMCEFFATGATGGYFLWNGVPSAGGPPAVTDPQLTTGINSSTARCATGVGGTFGSHVLTQRYSAVVVSGLNMGGAMASGSVLSIDVDSQGRLIVNITGSPGCAVYIRMTFSGVFGNAF